MIRLLFKLIINNFVENFNIMIGVRFNKSLDIQITNNNIDTFLDGLIMIQEQLHKPGFKNKKMKNIEILFSSLIEEMREQIENEN